jgi:hypothetical protein
MEPFWTAGDWDGQAPVTRHDARLIREPISELRLVVGQGAENQGEKQYQVQPTLDDPWQFLAHVPEVWGAIVGRADSCLGMAVDVAWIRRVVPRAGESNRSRWDTDPVWRVVQRAPFDHPTPLAARRLVRRQQRRHAVEQLDQQLLGLLKTREALLHADPSGRDLSLALRDVLRFLERELQRRGEDFGETARVRRRDRGLPVAPGDKVLPLWPRRSEAEVAVERAHLRELNHVLDAVDA